MHVKTTTRTTTTTHYHVYALTAAATSAQRSSARLPQMFSVHTLFALQKIVACNMCVRMWMPPAAVAWPRAAMHDCQVTQIYTLHGVTRNILMCCCMQHGFSVAACDKLVGVLKWPGVCMFAGLPLCFSACKFAVTEADFWKTTTKTGAHPKMLHFDFNVTNKGIYFFFLVLQWKSSEWLFECIKTAAITTANLKLLL